MTFILGLNCLNGLVLCADSLQTDGYTKKNVKKIFSYQSKDEWGLAFGCSGTAAACTNFSDRLLELLNDNDSYDRRGTEKLIEATMKYMRQQYPDELLDVVIGLWSANPLEIRLYKAHSNTQCLSVEDSYACAGLDVSLARFLLDSVFTTDTTVSEGSYIATFVTSIMKEKADGVGGPIQIMIHSVGSKGWFTGEARSVAEIEKDKFNIEELEKVTRQFCWSKFPHQFRPEKN